MSITLTKGIPNWFVDQFSDDLYQVCQQTESLFGQAVRVEDSGLINTEDKAFDMMDEFTLTEKSGRSPDTPTIDPSTQRRWVETTPYHNSVLFDRDDDLDMKLEPTGDFVTAFRRAVNRKKDDIIYAAFEAAVTSGRRAGSSITWASQDGNVKYTGADSNGDIDGRTIAHDTAVGNSSASNTGMTAEKAELIVEYFANNNVDESIPIFCAISPRQATQMFGQEQYVNKDYGSPGPHATGQFLRNWMGINWIRSTKVLLGSSNDVDGDTDVYECWAWAMDGMILGVADELTVEITERADKSYAQQVYVHMNMGCMRMDEDKVLKIECQA
ncbi:hypothetical protein KAR91_50795 [Candidatus Pacearchaeota archaeon]|nr:hypothetical protein [Candidatus Pacearchaeota archaeon]